MFSTSAWIKGLSNISFNLSAGWFGAAFITPTYLHQANWFATLTYNIGLGIVFMTIGVLFDTVKIHHVS